MSIATAITARLEEKSDSIERARAEFNYASIQPFIRSGSEVLDVGAWRCHLGRMLHEKDNCRVLSVDVVDGNRAGMPHRIFDGVHLPADDNSQDVVLLLYVLHHARSDEALLREAYRVLRPGGTVLVAEDQIDGPLNWALTLGFHVWLRLVTGMTRDGEFRTNAEWLERFRQLNFKVKEAKDLGHHLGRRFWPRNVLYVLEKSS